MNTTTTTIARTDIDQDTIVAAIEAHDAFNEQVQLNAVDPIDGYERALQIDLDTATDDQEIAVIEAQMASTYDLVIRDQWLRAEEAAGAKGGRMPMDHDLRSAFAAFAHLPLEDHVSQVRRILAGMHECTLEALDKSKLEDLIVAAPEWMHAAREGDRFDAAKSDALKQAVQDWGVIETSREVVRHRDEAEDLIIESEVSTGCVAWAETARQTIEVRPRPSAMAELTKAAHDPNYVIA